MTDFLSKRERSHRMSLIRGKDTKHEVRLRKALWREGLRYRKHYDLSGKPDIAFPTKRVVVFCDGCFWHGCPTHYKPPQSRKKYWREKIRYNKGKDARITRTLEKDGWKVIRVCECEIQKDLGKVVDMIKTELDFSPKFARIGTISGE